MGNCCCDGASTIDGINNSKPPMPGELLGESKKLYLNTVAEKDQIQKESGDSKNKNITSDDTN